ncbi:hypothetical protein HMPREF2837_00935 [Streptococcus sp. HMSC071D03]|nr:hypothetical protein HMPREF2837_00935 [Streptococcus sp. HMSC071D03]
MSSVAIVWLHLDAAFYNGFSSKMRIPKNHPRFNSWVIFFFNFNHQNDIFSTSSQMLLKNIK